MELSDYQAIFEDDQLFCSHTPDAVIKIANEAILKFPTFAFAYKAKAVALFKLGDWNAAIDNLFVSLRYNKTDFQVFFFLGHFLAQQRRFDDALKVIDESLFQHPAQAIAYATKANILYCLYRPNAEIVDAIAEALLLDEKQSDALNLLKELYKNPFFYEETLNNIFQKNATAQRQALKFKRESENEKSAVLKAQLLEKAVELCPDNADYLSALSHAYASQGDYEKAVPLLEKAILKNTNKADFSYESCRMIQYPYTEISAQQMGDFARGFVKHYPETPLFSFKTQNPNRPKKRLKIAFLTADLRNHAVAKFLESFLAAAQNTTLDFYAYLTKDIFDEKSGDIVGYFRRVQKVDRLTDINTARLIHQDRIDILFDLSGFTIGNRLNVFRFRPAPVSATWLGWSGTTGSAGIDYVLCHKLLTENDSFGTQFSESPAYLPEALVVFTKPEGMPDVSLPPLLTKKHITFGAFQNPNKVTNATIFLWSAVLNALPNAQMIWMRGDLADPFLRERYYKAFEEAGLKNAENRIFLKHNASQKEYFAAHKDVDFVLDSFPASSGTTAFDSAFMGVPTLCLVGQLMASRLSALTMQNLNLNEWIAHSKADFVAKAVEFSKDFEANPQKLANLRKGLRQGLLHSPLCDAPRFAKHFENLMWQLWQQKTQP